MILQRKPDENSKWPWLLIKHLQRKRKWFLFYFKIRTNNKNHCKSTLHWGKHTFWIWRYICKGFGPQVVLQTPFQNKTPHPQPTCLFFTEMGRRLKTEFGSAAPCCWWKCWWKSRKQLQESKMGTCLIRHLDWELLLKEPSAWPTSCNFPNLLSYDCPTQPPSWLLDAPPTLQTLLCQHYCTLRSQASFRSFPKCHCCRRKKRDTFPQDT